MEEKGSEVNRRAFLSALLGLPLLALLGGRQRQMVRLDYTWDAAGNRPTVTKSYPIPVTDCYVGRTVENDGSYTSSTAVDWTYAIISPATWVIVPRDG